MAWTTQGSEPRRSPALERRGHLRCSQPTSGRIINTTEGGAPAIKFSHQPLQPKTNWLSASSTNRAGVPRLVSIAGTAVLGGRNDVLLLHEVHGRSDPIPYFRDRLATRSGSARFDRRGLRPEVRYRPLSPGSCRSSFRTNPPGPGGDGRPVRCGWIPARARVSVPELCACRNQPGPTGHGDP